MSIFDDVLTAAAAAFVPETTSTASADAFGRDLSCLDDVDETAREVEGDEALAQAWARRLDTPRGSLDEDDPDYGTDCRSFLHRKMEAAEIASIPGQIRSELLKDERTLDVTVRLISFEADTLLECELDGFTAEGPFRFTFAATPDSVSVLLRGED